MFPTHPRGLPLLLEFQIPPVDRSALCRPHARDAVVLLWEFAHGPTSVE